MAEPPPHLKESGWVGCHEADFGRVSERVGSAAYSIRNLSVGDNELNATSVHKKCPSTKSLRRYYHAIHRNSVSLSSTRTMLLYLSASQADESRPTG